MFHHPPQLYQSGNAEDNANYPVKNPLVCIQFVNQKLAPEYEYGIPDKSANTDAADIGIVIIHSRFQNIFGI